jgi:Tfp pilus assembly protein PilN
MAKAAPKQPSDININLMPSREAAKPGGFLHWSLTIGRYLVILTEIVALIIFGLSIVLTAQKNDLKDEIDNLSTLVRDQTQFENEFRNTQNRINEVARVRSAQFKQYLVLTEFTKLLPQGISLESLSLDGEQLSFGGAFASPAQLQSMVLSFSDPDQKRLVGLNITTLRAPTQSDPNYHFVADVLILETNFRNEPETVTTQSEGEESQ